MTTLTIRLTGICSGGGHLTLTISGVKSATVPVDLTEMTQPITDEDMDAFCRVIIKMARTGRTAAQTRTLLQAGVTVTV